MPGEMAVHLFDVRANHRTPPLAELLERVHQDGIADRLKIVGQQEVRLETVAPPHSEGNNTAFWLLDFTKIRFEHGPGKASRDDPIEGFDLEADQGFGEETAALFDPQRQVILIQYNHYGVRSSIIKNYFALYGHNDNAVGSYEFNIRMDQNADVRFAQKEVITKMHFKIAPPRMSAEQRAGDVSLGRSLDVSDNLGAETIEVIVSAGRGPDAGLSFERVTALARNLMGMRRVEADEEPILSKLEIVGRDSLLEPLDVVDLLKPKLEQRISDLILGADRRYTQRSRWDGLIRARNGWGRVIAG